MSIFIRDAGVWKEPEPHVRDAGVWKPLDTGHVRDAGVWKEFYSGAADPGQFHHTSTTVVSWQVPDGVKMINCVCIGSGGPAGGSGGGALAYSNNISVVPGEILTVVAGHASNGSYLRRGSTNLVMAANGSNTTGGQASSSVGAVRYSGGNGYNAASTGGGGAAGFSGNGGNGGVSAGGPGSDGSGGGGGGGGGGRGGGGNGGMVQGTSGVGGNSSNGYNGRGGSGGQDGAYGKGGDYGGGQGGASSGGSGGGSVYIVWGEGREFPFDSAPV